MNRELIFEHLNKDVKYLEDNKIEWVAVLLQGSQNYNLDYEGSDIDTKAIVLPSFDDFCLAKSPMSITHVNEDNSHLDIKDLRLMLDCFRKQNVNFLEVLFTRYYILNPRYQEEFLQLKRNDYRIAHYNNYAALNTMVGMCLEKYKAMEHPYPATKDKIDKYGYDGKQLHHILRLREFIYRYLKGETYASCLISNQRDFLVRVKKNEAFNLEEAREIASIVVNELVALKKDYFDKNPVIIDKEVDILFKKVTLSAMKKNFKENW